MKDVIRSCLEFFDEKLEASSVLFYLNKTKKLGLSNLLRKINTVKVEI